MAELGERAADLLVRCLDREARGAERAELLAALEADASLRAALSDTLRVGYLLEQEFGGSQGFAGSVMRAVRDQKESGRTVAGVMGRLAARRTRTRWRVLAAAAVVLLAAGIAVATWRGVRRPPRIRCRIADSSGAILRGSGSRWGLLGPSGEATLLAGERLRVLEGARVSLAYPDGTVVALGPATEVELEGGDGTRMRLEEGEIQAEVTRRGSGPALSIRALECEVVVVGTRFRMSVRDGQADLRVRQGRVSVRDSRGGQRTVGEDQTARWDGGGEVRRFRIVPGATFLDHDYRAGLPGRWTEGLWVPDGGGLTRPIPEENISSGFHHAAIRSTAPWPKGWGALERLDSFNVTCRFGRRKWLNILIGVTGDDSKPFNIIHTVPSVSPGRRWQTLSVPLEYFRGVRGGIVQTGQRYMYYLLLPPVSADLEVTRVWLARGRMEPITD